MFFEMQKRRFLAKVFSIFRSKRGLRTIYRFLSQCIKTGYDLLYIAILLRELMKYSEVKLTELKHYRKQESQCLSKRLFTAVVGLR